MYMVGIRTGKLEVRITPKPPSVDNKKDLKSQDFAYQIFSVLRIANTCDTKLFYL